MPKSEHFFSASKITAADLSFKHIGDRIRVHTTSGAMVEDVLCMLIAVDMTETNARAGAAAKSTAIGERDLELSLQFVNARPSRNRLGFPDTVDYVGASSFRVSPESEVVVLRPVDLVEQEPAR